jgi:hypothetical protein
MGLLVDRIVTRANEKLQEDCVGAEFIGILKPANLQGRTMDAFYFHSGVYRYMKEGRMAWPLTRIVIVGTLPGAFIGNYLRVLYLLNPKAFTFFVGCMLLYIGARLLYELTARSQKGKQEMKALETKFNDHVIIILTFQAALISVNGFSRLSLTVHCDPCRFPDTLADVREALARMPAALGHRAHPVEP